MSGTIVVIKKDFDREEWLRVLRTSGLPFSEYKGLPRHFLIPDVPVDTFVLRDHPAVEIAEADDLPAQPAQDLSIAEDITGDSWAIARIIRRSAPWPTRRLQFPWDTTFNCVRDGLGVDWYSIDSGFRLTHDEITGRATNVYEAVSSGGAGDDFGHGTNTATVACGSTVGLARNALLWSFKVISFAGVINNAHIVSALGEVLSHYNGRSGTNRPAVLNMSIVNASNAANAALGDCIAAGIFVVACAGNTLTDLGTIDMFPAEGDADILVVGGTGVADIPYYGGAVYQGTNWGTRVDILAPSNLVKAGAHTANDAFITVNGTSFACAYASGAVACMLQGHARLANRAQVQAVKTHVVANATTGRINATAFAQAGVTTLTDRLMYLDPLQVAPESISGL